MATEIDALSLNITASSRDAITKIDDLIKSLHNLDLKFRNLSSSATYANNLETAVKAITRVNNAIANIDSGKVADVGKALKTLSNGAKSLSAFDSMNTSMQGVSSNAQRLAQNLAKSFNIKDKGVIRDMTSSIQTMQDTMGKGDAFYKAEAHLNDLVKSYGKVKNELYEVDNAYEKVRKYLNSNTIYIPKGSSAEQDYLKNRARIGIKNTTSDPTKGLDISKVQSDLQKLVPSLQSVINPQDIFGSLGTWLEQNATSPLISMQQALDRSDDAWNKLAGAIDNVERSLGIVVPTMEQLASVKDNLDLSGITDINEMLMKEAEAIQQFRDGLQSATTNMQTLNQTMSQTTQASQPFENIVAGLESLQGVQIGDFSNINVLAEGVNKLGYQSAVTASQILPSVAQGLRSFDGIVLPTLDGMEGFSQGIRSLGSKAVQNAAYSLPFVADGLKQFQGINIPNLDNLVQLGQSISMFGRAAAEKAVTNIPQLAKAFKQLFSSMQNVPKISQNTIDAANAFARLATNAGGASTALTRVTPKLNLWSKTAKSATSSTFSLAAAIGKVYASYWMLFRAFSMIGKTITIASDLTEVRNVVTHAFDDMAYKAEEFANTAGELFGMSKLDALDAASRYQAMGKTMGITNDMVIASNKMLRESLSDVLEVDYVNKAYGDLGDTAADMSINLTKLAGDLASLYNKDIEVAAEKLNSIFTGTTKPLREFGFDLTQANLKEWALTNGLNANIKEMTQAEKAVLRYQYVMANAGFVLGDFVRTSETWHNSIVRLKLAFKNLGAVIGQGFINLLKPVIQKITAFINTLTGLIQKGINAIGKLLGWQVEIDPVAASDESLGGGTEDMADAMEDAEDASGGTADNLKDGAKSAKKMKDYLLGIDELNVFKPDEDSDSGKSGSGSGSGAGGGSKGGATGGEVQWKKYESDINSWFGLGQKLNAALKEALQGIDWDGIQAKWAKFGAGFASFLNGFNQDATTFKLIGSTIAEAINTIATAFESFFKWFNGHKFGIDLGNIINGFIENLDWNKIQNAAKLMAEDIGKTINGAVGTVKWDKVGKTIAEALNTVITFYLTLGNTIDWKKIGSAFAKTVNGFFDSFKFKDLAKTLNTWANGLLDAIITALKKIKWSKIGTKIGEFIAEINFTQLLGKAIKAIWLAINGLIKTYSAIFDAAPIETAIGTVVLLFGGFGSTILNIVKNSAIVTGLTNIATKFKDIGSSISTVVLPAIQSFDTSFTAGEGVLKSFTAGANTLRSSFSAMTQAIGSAATAIAEFFLVKDAVSDLVSGTGDLATNITKLVGAVAVASVAFTALLGFPAGLIASGITAAIAGFAGLYEAVSKEIDTSVWNSIGDAMTKPGGTPVEEITAKYDNAFARITEGFNMIAVKSEGLDVLKTGMSEASSEVNLLAFAFENGAAVTDEKIDEITTSFNRLLTDSQSIFNQEYDVIMAGLAGAFGETLTQLGYQVPEIIGYLDEIRGSHELEIQAIQNKMEELKTSYANGEIDAQEYGAAILEQAQKYREITGETDTYKEAVSGLSETISSVDMSGLVTELDGVKQVDMDTLSTQFDTLKESYQLASQTIDSSSEGMVSALEDYRAEAERTKNSKAINVFDDMITANATSASEAKTQMSTDLIEYGNLIQQGLVEDIPNVIEQAMSDYDKLSPLAKFTTSEEDYVQTAVSNYKTNVIDPTCKELQSFYKDTLGTEVATYAGEAAEMIAAGLVDETIYDNTITGGMPVITQSFCDDIQGLIEDATKAAKDNAGNISEGLVEGMKQTDLTWFGQFAYNDITKGLETSFDMHSPSKKMETYGKNIMLGVIEGFKNTASSFAKAASDWYEKSVKPWFTVARWSELGNNIKTAILTKWTEFTTQWITKITTWWNSNVIPWFNLDKWKIEADHIRDAIITKFTETVSQWITKITNWWNQNVVPWFNLDKWKTEADHIRDAIITKFNEMVSEWITKITNWWENHVKPWFKLETWKELANNIKEGILGAIDAVKEEWGSKIQGLVDDFSTQFSGDKFIEIGKTAINSILDGFKQAWSSIVSWVTEKANWIKSMFTFDIKLNGGDSSGTTTKKNATGGVFSGGRWHNVQAYASGGMPDSAQLFMAREAGPELVGTIGSATAVINNEQIVASVAAGVQSAVTQALSPYLSEITTNTRITANKDLTLNIGDRQIAEANNRGQRAIGAALLT